MRIWHSAKIKTFLHNFFFKGGEKSLCFVVILAQQANVNCILLDFEY